MYIKTRKKTFNFTGFLALIPIGIICAVVYGYIANVVKFATMIANDAPIAAEFVGRAVGLLIAPLGIVLGYF